MTKRTIFLSTLLLIGICTPCLAQKSSLADYTDEDIARFIESLTPLQAREITTKAVMPVSFLRPDQYKLYARFAIKFYGTSMGALCGPLSDKGIVSLPMPINMYFAASFSAESNGTQSETTPVFSYSRPNYFLARPGTVKGGPDFARMKTGFDEATQRAQAERFARLKPLRLGKYPSDLPIPESAYRRGVRVTFSSLTPVQQQFVLMAYKNCETMLPTGFTWKNATLQFSNNIYCHSGIFEIEQNPLYSPAHSFSGVFW